MIQMRDQSSASGNLLAVTNMTRPRAHSALAPEYQYLKLKINNDAEVDRLKKSFQQQKPYDPHSHPSHQLSNRGIAKNQKQAELLRKDEMAFEIEDMDQHSIPLQELCFRLGTRIDSGLSSQQALKRSHEEGDNKLPQKQKTAAWIRFSLQMITQFALLQWIAAFLCVIIYIVSPEGNQPMFVMAFVIIFIILLTGSITYMQGAKSETIMGGLQKIIPDVCRVRRQGKVVQIDAEKLVRGDIVEINPGDKIPADLRIITAEELKVDNSSLTGEEVSISKSSELTHPKNPFLTKNLVFYGTLCVGGRGQGIVIQTGAKTVVGRIAALAAEGDKQKSLLRSQMDRLMIILSLFSVALSLILFFVSLFGVKYSLKESIIILIGLLLANVPEGLLACATISLALGTNRLAEKGVLIKNLQSVDALGSTSCFCLDKTGMITETTMTVQNLWFNSWIFKAHNKESKEIDIKSEYDQQDPSFQIMGRTALLTSEASFNSLQPQIVVGDSWDLALLKFYKPLTNFEKIREKYPFAKCKDYSFAKIPFCSSYKYSLSIVREEGANHHWVIYIKGAPEIIWEMCSKINKKGEPSQINLIDKKDFLVANSRFAKEGDSVLGFAMLPLNKEIYHQEYRFQHCSQQKQSFPMKGFIFVGLISMSNHLKKGISEAIQKCKNAGIKIIMFSGDQASTVGAIAKKVGLITGQTNQDLKEKGCSEEKAIQKSNSVVIQGEMIISAVQEEQNKLEEWCQKKQVVFARTTPSEKIMIVQAAQRIGLKVGVIGYTAEDSPAIKQGDVGISLNLTGSDLTRDAADMILLNDDFASLIEGVEEGRRIFDNLKKTIVYMLTSNMSQIWPFLAMVVLQIPLPLSMPLLLAISVGTDIYPALSLCLEEPEWDIMTIPPRNPHQHLLSAQILGHTYGYMGQLAACGGFFTYNIIMSCYGIPFQIYLYLLTKQRYVPMVNDTLDLAWNQQPNYSDDFNQGHYSPDAINLNASSYFTETCIQALNKGNIGSRMFYPSWLSTLNSKVDLRVTYVDCCAADKSNFCPQFNWPDESQVLGDISPISGVPVMFTTEALFYAQSGYFVSVVMIQCINLFCCRSPKTSVIYMKRNNQMLGAIFFQICLFVFLLYVPMINKIFGGRPLPFFLMGIPGLGFAILLLGWQQLRKALICRGAKGNWFQSYLLW